VKRWLLIALAAVTLIAAYPAWLGFQIWDQSRRDEARPADAIVVLGAAQYNGEPSRVFQARLDHAAYLYREGFSDTVIVTGGKAEGDRFTEAEAGSNYLVAQEQVPSTNILQEDRGRTTLESLKAVATIADENGIESLLLVSDPMHSERIKRMAQDLGFEDAYVSWASYVELNRSRSTKLKELVREIGSLISYELLDR
jgi:uncharacterized SAM-binding protein YcdF (DUF218 family)